MRVPFSIYSKIVNNYCLSYEGKNEELVQRMKSARTHIKLIYPELRVFLCVMDQIIYVLDGESDVLAHSSLDDKFDEFAVIYDVKNNDSLDEFMKLEKKSEKQEPNAYIISKTMTASKPRFLTRR